MKAFFCSIKLRHILNIRKSPHCSTVSLTCWSSKRLLTIKMCRSLHGPFSIHKFISLSLAITRYYYVLRNFCHFLWLWLLTSKIIQFLEQSDMSYFSSFNWSALDFLLTHVTNLLWLASKCTRVKWKLRKKLDINFLNRQPQIAAHCKIMLSETTSAKTAVKSSIKVSCSSLLV